MGALVLYKLYCVDGIKRVQYGRVLHYVPKARCGQQQNQSNTTGPNKRPTTFVPCRCKANRPPKIISAAGITTGSKDGVIISNPSTAPKTEMAG